MTRLPFKNVFADQQGTDQNFPGFLLVDHGRTETADPRALASCFGQVTLKSVDFGLQNLQNAEAAFPALYLARHTVELYLKGLVPDWNERRKTTRSRSHHIDYLVDILREKLRQNYEGAEVSALTKFLHQFAMLSPQSMEFRYRDGAVISFGDAPLDDPEIWVNFEELRKSLAIIFEALDKVWRQQPQDVA